MIPTISEFCGQFLKESDGLPLLKNLPVHNDGFRRVKVRKHTKKDTFDKAFNEAFSVHYDLRQRSIFANGDLTLKGDILKDLEPFYIFPKDGYQYLYSLSVFDSNEQYKDTFDEFVKQLSSPSRAISFFKDVLKYNYVSNNLPEGIRTGSEIIIYGIPYYYAIRKSLIESYENMIYD